MAERFIICRRKSRKRQPTARTDDYFFVWFRDSQGRKLPENRILVDTLTERLTGTRRHITSKLESFKIAEEALKAGIIFDYVPEPEITLSDYVTTFWDYEQSPYVKRKRIEGNPPTENYCRKMLGTFKNHVEGELPEGLPLSGFTLKMLERIKAGAFDKGLSAKTISQIILTVRTPLSEAYRLELINSNIAEKIRLLPPRFKTERGILTTEETQALMLHLSTTSEPNTYERWKFLTVSLGLFCGLRNSEIRGLKVDCIDSTNNTIRIESAFVDFDGLKGTKTGKTRIVPAPVGLIGELVRYTENRTGFVFFNINNPDKPLPKSSMQKAFSEGCKAIGLDVDEQEKRHLSFYSLRHTNNSMLVASGLSTQLIAEVTGHTVGMVAHYNHQNDTALKEQDKARRSVLPYIGENEHENEQND